mmetsp:Transcript_36561/g.67350  ORF Transcript_36561/g.67350 Transcript_36561/m.67350 type:complete len:2044 (+) Transcript_36561:177-6308(+)
MPARLLDIAVTGRPGSQTSSASGSDAQRVKKYPPTLQGKVDFLGDLMETHEAQIRQLQSLNEGLKRQGELLQEENNVLRESIGDRANELKVTRRLMECAGILPAGAWEAALQGKLPEQRSTVAFQNAFRPGGKTLKGSFSSKNGDDLRAIVSKHHNINRAQDAKATLRNLKASMFQSPSSPSSPIAGSGFPDALQEAQPRQKRRSTLTPSPTRGQSMSPTRSAKPKPKPMKIVKEEADHDLVYVSDELYAAAQPLLDNILEKDAQRDVLHSVQCLLDRKASPNKWTGPETPLHAAALAHHTELVRCLLGSRANPNQTDDRGVTVLHIAVFDRAEELCKVLLQGLVNPNACDKHGQTPLFFAPTPDFCLMLCGAKADPYLLNHQRQSALHFAARAGLGDVLVWFARNVRKRLMDQSDEYGATAMYYARAAGVRPELLRDLRTIVSRPQSAPPGFRKRPSQQMLVAETAGSPGLEGFGFSDWEGDCSPQKQFFSPLFRNFSAPTSPGAVSSGTSTAFSSPMKTEFGGLTSPKWKQELKAEKEDKLRRQRASLYLRARQMGVMYCKAFALTRAAEQTEDDAEQPKQDDQRSMLEERRLSAAQSEREQSRQKVMRTQMKNRRRQLEARKEWDNIQEFTKKYGPTSLAQREEPKSAWQFVKTLAPTLTMNSLVAKGKRKDKMMSQEENLLHSMWKDEFARDLFDFELPPEHRFYQGHAGNTQRIMDLREQEWQQQVAAATRLQSAWRAKVAREFATRARRTKKKEEKEARRRAREIKSKKHAQAREAAQPSNLAKLFMQMRKGGGNDMIEEDFGGLWGKMRRLRSEKAYRRSRSSSARGSRQDNDNESVSGESRAASDDEAGRVVAQRQRRRSVNKKGPTEAWDKATIHRLPDRRFKLKLWRDGELRKVIALSQFAMADSKGISEDLEGRAVQVIQRAWRRTSARRHAAATKIQSWERRRKGRLKPLQYLLSDGMTFKERLAQLNEATLKLQSKFRGDKDRQLVEKKRMDKQQSEAATKMQARHRGNQARARAEELKERKRQENEAATKLQARHRGNAGRQLAQEKKQEREAVMWLIRKKQEREAATKLQAIYRGSAARRQVEAKKRKIREEEQRRHMAASKVQAMYRGNVARKERARQQEEARLAEEALKAKAEEEAAEAEAAKIAAADAAAQKAAEEAAKAAEEAARKAKEKAAKAALEAEAKKKAQEEAARIAAEEQALHEAEEKKAAEEKAAREAAEAEHRKHEEEVRAAKAAAEAAAKKAAEEEAAHAAAEAERMKHEEEERIAKERHDAEEAVHEDAFWKRIDKGDGLISDREYRRAKERGIVSEDSAAFDDIDSNGDLKIDWEEFKEARENGILNEGEGPETVGPAPAPAEAGAAPASAPVTVEDAVNALDRIKKLRDKFKKQGNYDPELAKSLNRIIKESEETVETIKTVEKLPPGSKEADDELKKLDQQAGEMDDATFKFQTEVHPHGYKWWRFRWEYAFVEANILALLVWIMVGGYYLLDWVKWRIRKYAIWADSAKEAGSRSVANAFHTLLASQFDQLNVLGAISVLIWFLEECGLFWAIMKAQPIKLAVDASEHVGKHVADASQKVGEHLKSTVTAFFSADAASGQVQNTMGLGPDMHMPTTDHHYINTLRTVNVHLFIAMIMYYVLMYHVVYAAVWILYGFVYHESPEIYEQMKSGSDETAVYKGLPEGMKRKAQTTQWMFKNSGWLARGLSDGTLIGRFIGCFNKKEDFVNLHKYFVAKLAKIDEFMDPDEEGIPLFERVKAPLYPYFAQIIQNSCKKMIMIDWRVWLMVEVCLLLQALVHYYLHKGVIEILPFTIGAGVILLSAQYMWTRRAAAYVVNPATVADDEENVIMTVKTPGSVLGKKRDPNTGKTRAENWFLWLQQLNLFFLCFSCARLLASWWFWTDHPIKSMGLLLLFTAMYLFFIVIGAITINFYFILHALPPHLYDKAKDFLKEIIGVEEAKKKGERRNRRASFGASFAAVASMRRETKKEETSEEEESSEEEKKSGPSMFSHRRSSKHPHGAEEGNAQFLIP